ncbi:MAG TPA: hemolysin family protein [Spongiibacteraceae bacterium]|nr:hemolysin family protein [Spongiibacteraceae bacterium]
MRPAMGTNVLLILVAIFLVLLNGYFVAAEFALVKLRQTRVKAIAKVHGLRGRILMRVHSQMDAYLSACQLGITLASLGLGWVGEPAFAKLLEGAFTAIGIESPGLIVGLAFGCAFFTISFLHIVIGELAPKSLAIRMPESVAIWTAAPLYGFYWSMYPAIWALQTSANKVLRWVGLVDSANHSEQYSVDELKLILRGSHATNKFTGAEWNILAHTLDFSELEVADLMRPFREAVTLSANESFEQNLAAIDRHRFSRYPYIDADGQVTGILHLKDLFLLQQKTAQQKKSNSFADWPDLVRPVQYVAPDLPAPELFRRFRQGVPHFAIVGYKGEPPQGFITLDNMLSALVGEIRDEFRQAQNDWIKLDDGTLMGKGSLPLFTLERALGVEIESIEAESVGGLILWKLNEIPKEGDKIDFDEFSIVVKKMNGPRIVLVRIYPRSVTGDAD